MGFSIMLNQLTVELTPIQINAAVISLEGALLWNRLFWLGISMLALLYTYSAFDLHTQPLVLSWWKRRKEKQKVQSTGAPRVLVL
jgi:hypothetical protein